MASSSRGVQQDSFIDDDDLTCPLCVEEFDLSDRNFRPCPCGYQVCQFCFNNIKNNMNGLCPACRRPYDEKTMEFKIVTPEEIAQFKANAQKNAKKKAAERQKEAQKREVESLNRKHLAGLRVVQKNLVYVVGLSPGIPEQDLLKTLRGDKYFGQYGNIIKIVVSKAKAGDSNANSSLGVYVTFQRKEDAARCIAAVNGSQNGDRVLRAQLGTTKYCSAYLRNETCTNKQCMFLHEPGDNDDSYSRQDLSSINSVSTQRPLPVTTPSAASANRQAAQAQAPIQQSQPVAAASQVMARESSKEGSDSGDGSALPSSASWANRSAQITSRRGSMATSGAASSPAVSSSVPAATEANESTEEHADHHVEEAILSPSVTGSSSKPPVNGLLLALVKSIRALSTCPDTSSESNDLFRHFPPLFDDEGGLKRRAIREQQQEEAGLNVEQDSNDIGSIAEPQEEEQPESGSFQLGGEPEDREDGRSGSQQSFLDQRRSIAQLPIQRSGDGQFGSLGQGLQQNLGNLASINGRTLTPTQQHQLLLLKSGQPQSNFLEQFPQGVGAQQSLFQQQGHNRQASRYAFANDNTSIKSAVNAKVTAQPSSLMSQPGGFYGSSISGPPPGLKSTGTPPINGNGMFAQGHGFGGALGGSAFGAATRESSNDIYREILRSRGGIQGVPGHDAGKRDILSLDDASFSVDALVADSAADTFGSPGLSQYRAVSRSSTPSVPPGLGLPHGHAAPTIREDPIAKPARIMPTSAPFPPITPITPTRNISSHIPRAATPLANVSIPATPISRAATPLVPVSSASKAKQDVKTLATDSGLSKTIASQAIQGATQPVLQPEDFPVLQKGKAKEQLAAATPKSLLPVPNKTPTAKPGHEAPTLSDPIEKRPAAIVNETTASVQSSGKQVPAIDTTVKHPNTSAAFPPLPPSTPASAATPVGRAAPKTLRVVPTPKSETPASLSTPISSASFAAPPLQSRQPSLASVARLDRPSTPASEIISDNASITSASMSRPGSPPPSKVGSAPVRTTTKSQQKKQRKEAQREKVKENSEVVADRPEPEVEIAPIMGRKKKQKKEKIIVPKSTKSTPVASRHQSPGPQTPIESEKPSKAELLAEQNATAQIKQDSEATAKADSKGKGKAKVEEVTVLEPPKPSVAKIEKPQEKPMPTPSSVLKDLVSAGIIPDPTNLVVFKAPVASNQRPDFAGDFTDLEHKLIITEEDRLALQAGHPVHKVVDGVSRILLTPNGDCVRNLTPEEEERYLELQTRISKESGPTAFVSARHNTSNGFTLIGGRAVPNGPPSFYPQSDAVAATLPRMDAVSKIQRDEALSYINQYVLPSLSTNSQLERALNANALEAENLRPGETQKWDRWSMSVNTNPDIAAAQQVHTAAVSTPYGSNSNNDGILATGLEHMTAHFAIGRESGTGRAQHQPLGNVSLLNLNDAEAALQLAKRESDKLEKSLSQIMKKNRRVLLGTGH